MSTHSTIAVQQPNGTVHQVYCHWDGYIEHTGLLLLDKYSFLELAQELVVGGDISLLGSCTDTTIYYMRDKKETNLNPSVFTSLDDYYENAGMQEYNYLFANGEWRVKIGADGVHWVSLEQAVADTW